MKDMIHWVKSHTARRWRGLRFYDHAFPPPPACGIMADVKNVLIYTQPGSLPIVWDVSTPELRDEAFLQLFQTLDAEGAFQYLEPAEYQLHNMARRGNGKFARALLLLKEVPFSEVPVIGMPDLRPVVGVEVTEAKSDSSVPSCCANERRNFNGGCDSCGAPCF